MNYHTFKKSFLVFLAAGMYLAACNNNQSSNTTSDTSTSMMSTDTTATVPADTGSSMAPDTNKMIKDTAMNKKASGSTLKKKGKATVSMLPITKHPKIAMDKTGIYEYSEVLPTYPGGESALEDYVTNNINYPDAALNDGKIGKVNVAFTVDENGKVTDAHSVSNNLGDGLDEEAVRVVSSMHDWKPGTVKGKPVKVRMTLPITFQLQE